MKCPSCGYQNIQGEDNCDSCQADLTSCDGVTPKSKVERVLMEDHLSNLKPKQAICVNENATVLQAIQKMNEIRAGSVCVENDAHEMSGILTERDILMRVMGKYADLTKVSVKEVMTADPECLEEEDTLAYALHQMSVKRYRHIPVLRADQAPGIITARDVLQYLAKLFP